jgi:heat shock protein HtpX
MHPQPGGTSTGPHDLIRKQINVNKAMAIVLVAAFLVNAAMVAAIVGAFAGPAGVLITGILLLAAVAWTGITFHVRARSHFDTRPPGPEDLQRLEPIVSRMAQRMSIAPPAIRILPDDGVLNACSWSVGGNATVAYTPDLLDALDDEELEAVTAHELGHIVSRDSRMYNFATAVLDWARVMCHLFAIIATFFAAMGAHFLHDRRNDDDDVFDFILGLVFGIGFLAAWLVVVGFSHIWFLIARLLHLGVIRQREWMADGIAAEATGKPKALADALAAVAAGPTRIEHGGRALQGACIAGAPSPESSRRRGVAAFDLLDDHPSPERRIARLEGLTSGDGTTRPAGSVAIGIAAVLTVALAVPVVIGIVGVFRPSPAFSSTASGTAQSVDAGTPVDGAPAPGPASPGTAAPSGADEIREGLVTVAAGPWSGDLATAVASTLGTYFEGINNKNFSSAYAMFSAPFQARVPLESWSRGLSSSTDQDIVVHVIQPATAVPRVDPVQVGATFTSHQAPDQGPVPGETCTEWSLTYSLVPGTQGYVIDGVAATTGNGHAACGGITGGEMQSRSPSPPSLAETTPPTPAEPTHASPAEPTQPTPREPSQATPAEPSHPTPPTSSQSPTPTEQQEPLPSAPVITDVSTYAEDVLVYVSVRYADPDEDAVGFGFRGIEGAGWAQETQTFEDTTYGRASPGRIDYPFNLGCGTSSSYESDVEFWIYDAGGRQSEAVPVHLAC